jgi:hypothetical protein
LFFFLAHGCHAALDAPKKVCPDAVDSCTKTAWENGGLRGMPRLPVFLSKHKVPLGFALDAKHPEANLQMLCDFVEEEGVRWGKFGHPLPAAEHGALGRRGESLRPPSARIFTAAVARRATSKIRGKDRCRPPLPLGRGAGKT